MRMWLLVGAVVAVVGGVRPGPVVQARWAIHDLGTFGPAYQSSSAVDINDSGQIVGGCGAGQVGRAFIWQDGTMSPLGTLGGLTSSAAAINDEGEVIGGSLTAKPAKGHGFLWQNGKMIDIVMGPRAINDHGQIVGGIKIANGKERAALWQNGTVTDLGTLGGRGSLALAINERGQVVGEADTAEGHTHAFLWQNGRMRDLGTLGRDYAAGSTAVSINDRGQIVGTSWSSTISYGQLGGGQHAFLWQDGRMRDLGTLGRYPQTSSATKINDRGEIIGESPASGNWHAFLWRNGTLTDIGSLGVGWTQAVDINDRGHIVGNSASKHGQHAFEWQHGVMYDLGTLGGATSDARAINQHDQIAGSSNRRNGSGRAVFWTLRPAPHP